jgi:hypothetical protein
VITMTSIARLRMPPQPNKPRMNDCWMLQRLFIRASRLELGRPSFYSAASRRGCNAE